MALTEEQIAIVMTFIEKNGGAKAATEQLKKLDAAERAVAKSQQKRARSTAEVAGMMGTYQKAIKKKGKQPFTTPMGGMMPPFRGTTNIPPPPPPPSPTNPVPTIGRMNKFPQPEKFKDIEWIPTGASRFIPQKPPTPEKKLSFAETKRGRILERVNKGFFKLQMASLGVFFSFMSIQMAITGLFTGLQNLGGAFKSMALGKAFGGVDVLGGMGVDPSQLVEGWKNITGIMGMISTLMTGIAAVALSPEVMTAIQSMFSELSKSLSDGKVAKALGDIIIAFTDMVKVVTPALPILADLISALGDAGLLKWILLLVFGSKYLLAILSLVGFALNFVTETIAAVTFIADIFGVTLGTLGLAVAAVLIVVDFLINLWENFQLTGWSLVTLGNALMDTLKDIANVIIGIINTIGGWAGVHIGELETVSGNASRNTQTTNNYNYNGNYDDPSALIDKTRKAQSTAY